jgi:HAD superfamily hydrolase (TIGR01549 family)
MAAEIAASPIRLRSVTRARRIARILQAYRRAHEELRGVASREPVATLQLRRAADRAQCSEQEARATVVEWMHERPLKYLRFCRRRDLLPLLEDLKARGLRLGVLSDYPSIEKLRVLGIDGFFSPVLCTTDPDVNALKPSPRGYWRACEIWKLPPEEVLYVGDRPEVDARGAVEAGSQCAVLPTRSGRHEPISPVGRYVAVKRLRDVGQLVAQA